MVNYDTDTLDAVFAALADPTRRSLLERLRTAPTNPSALAGPLGVSRPAVSKHLRVLERARLIERRRHGREIELRLAVSPLDHATQWLADHRAFWERQLDSLARWLDAQETSRPEEAPWPSPKRRPRSRSKSGAGSASRPRRSGRHGRKPRR